MTKPKYWKYRGEVPQLWPPEVIAYFGKTIAIEEEKQYCPSQYEGYSCTRKTGHRGPHVAHISSSEICAVWDEEESTHDQP